MKNQNIVKIIASAVLLLLSTINAGDILDCGIAEGYPPYQFQDTNGIVTGFDADIVRLLCKDLGFQVNFYQAPWDNVVATFYYTDRLDFVAGMEINAKRESLFAFTKPYYYRKIALFVRANDSNIDSIDHLIGRAVTSDRDSALEIFLEEIGIKGRIRLVQTSSKEQSFRLLKKQEVVAVIAPKAVGYYLANEIGLTVKVLTEAKERSPVGMAFKKYDRELLDRFETAIEKLSQEGKFDSLYKRWYINKYQENYE